MGSPKELYIERLNITILKHRSVFFFCLLIISVGINSCGVYSFTGTNISPAIQTIFVDNFLNISGNGPADLSQVFSEGLRETYQQNTNLEVIMEPADLTVNGEIISYQVMPVSPNPNEVADINRLKIVVRVNYFNRVNPEQDFENKQFSFFADFPQTQALQDVEEDLIDEIFRQLYLEIFTETVANW